MLDTRLCGVKLISVQVGGWHVVTDGLGADRTGVAEGRPVPVVFISYAHDDPAHEDRVRDFWLFLREQGIDARADLPAAERRQDWADWMTRQVRDADRVLVIASPEYRRRAEGDAEPGEGRGVQWEARLIRDRFYADQKAGLQLIVPVVLPDCSADDIPLWMGPTATTYYRVTEYTVIGAEKLLRLLTVQPWETEPPLGTIPTLPPRGAGATSHRPLTETGNETGPPDFAATGEQSDGAPAAVENCPPTARRARLRLRAIVAGVVGIIGVLASIATVVPQLDPFLSSPSPAKSSPARSNPPNSRPTSSSGSTPVPTPTYDIRWINIPISSMRSFGIAQVARLPDGVMRIVFDQQLTPANEWAGVVADIPTSCHYAIEMQARVTNQIENYGGYGIASGRLNSKSQPEGVAFQYDFGFFGYRTLTYPDDTQLPTHSVVAHIDNGWHQLLIIFDSSMTAYVDGRLVISQAATQTCGVPIVRVWSAMAEFRKFRIGQLSSSQ
jgi:hypothetical protein